MKEEHVLARVYEPRRLLEAWQQVKRNAGAVGIDRMTVEEFESRKEELFPIIYRELKAGSYRFKPARRVLIPKEGSKGKFRKLGILVIMDRIVSASMTLVFEEIFDPEFTESNFGFRKGKSQHQAIEQVRRMVEEGYEWCASVDLKSFFDEIPHDLILRLVRRKIADERLLTLVARALKAGVIVEGKYEKTTKGSPQGSPLSPMLSNIVLNELDHELERRGLKYCRWADDFLILGKSERAAKRVLEGITRYVEEELGLPVNKEKSEAALVKDVDFLGFRVLRNKIRVSEKSREKFKPILKDHVAAVRRRLLTQAVMRFETEPGLQAQVDWKDFGRQIVDGRQTKLYAFVMVLGYSRRALVHFTTATDSATMLACHLLAFEYFGGVSHEILYDNMKTAFVYATAGVWKANRWLAAVAAHYGFAPKRCQVRRPETKGKVERTIGYLGGNFWHGSGQSLSGRTE